LVADEDRTIVNLSESRINSYIIWNTALAEVLKNSSPALETSELREENNELKQQINKLNTFIPRMLHDIRAWLSGAASFSLELSNEKVSEEFKKQALEVLKLSPINALDLLDDFRDYYSNFLKKWQDAFQNINLSETVEKVILSCWDAAKNKDITIDYHNAWVLNILTDNDILSGTLRNLVNNAIKFTYIWGKIDIIVSESENFLEISVKDNGTGMSENTINSLFNIETTKSQKGTNREKGTWLWLITSKEWIELCNWEILVESIEWEWSTFTIKLPLA
jgi:signal transduction histidine kinase